MKAVSPSWLRLDADADAAALGRALGDAEADYIVLAAPATRLVEAGLNALLGLMGNEGGGTGFGAVRHAGSVSPPPATPEDIRFRRFSCDAVAVLERGVLTAALAACGWEGAEPDRRWRLLRAACAASLVVTIDQVVGETEDPAPLADFARLPPDLAAEAAPPELEPGIILIYGQVEASVSLYFDGLPPPLRRRLRFLRPADPLADLPHLLAASLVVIVRGFEYFWEEGTLDLLDAMHVPYAWFVDDHLVRLAEDQPGFEYYTAARVGAFMRRCAVVLAATDTLAEALRALGGDAITWACVFDTSMLPQAPGPGGRLTTLGAVGGSFRRRAFAASVLPALARLDPARRISLHARFDLMHGLDDRRLRPVPMTDSFRQFVFRWQRLRCQILLHPAGDAANMPYKSPATLLAALYLGAVPVVADEPAYRGLAGAGVLLAADTPKAWAAAIAAAAEPARRAAAYAELQAWCRRRFDPLRSFDNMRRLDSVGIPATAAERDRRLRRALAHPGLAALWAKTLPCRALPADPPMPPPPATPPPPSPAAPEQAGLRPWLRRLLQPRIARR